MSANEVIEELSDIRFRLYRLRHENNHAKWLGELLKAIESLVQATINALNHIKNVQDK